MGETKNLVWCVWVVLIDGTAEDLQFHVIPTSHFGDPKSQFVNLDLLF